MVAALARRFGDLDLAEEMAAEAFAVAVERWPTDGVPANPGAWITTTANRRAIDRLRRESRRDDKQKEAQMLYDDTPPEPVGAVDDDRLRLIFTCCHPALATEARIALTLRLVGGLTVAEIARAFLVQEADHGSADHPGQEQDQSWPGSRTGFPRRRTCPPGSPGSWRSSS